MKCPILSAPTARTAFTEHFADVNCLGAECAWWAPIAKCCSVLNAACELWRIGDALEELHNDKVRGLD